MNHRLLRIALVLVWAALVIVGYFVVHKPVLPDRDLALTRAIALLRLVLVVGWWLLTLLVAAGLGRWLGGRLGTSPIERVAFSAGLGLGAFSFLVLVAGLLGAIPSGLIGVLVLVAAVILLARPLRAVALDIGAGLAGLRPQGRLARLACLYTGLVLGMAFLWALAPPTGWDSLTYHLNGPKLYAEAGRIAHVQDVPYLGFPEMLEMAYLPAVRVGLPSAAQLVHWTYAALIAMLLADFTARRWGRPAGWMAAAIFLSAPTVFWLAGWAYVDLALAFYTLAAFVVLSNRACPAPGEISPNGPGSFPRLSSTGSLILAGALCGLAIATKYSAAPMACALLLLVLIRGDESKRPSVSARLRAAAWFGGAAALVAAPWYIKTWLTTGNPVYPFFLGGVFWDSWRAWWYGRWGTGLAFSQPWRLLVAPLEMTILGVEGAEGFSATIGPLFLMLAPLAALAWPQMNGERRRITLDILILLAVMYAGWLVQVAGSALLVQTRLILPAFPLLAILAAAGFSGLAVLDTPQLSARRVVGALAALTLILTAGGLAWDTVASDRLLFLSGARSRDAYLEAHLGAHYAAMRAVNTLPAGSRVLFLWEPRGFYCQVECWPDSLLDRWWHLMRGGGDPAAIAAGWRSQGFTHVLLYRTGYKAVVDARFDPITTQDQQALDSLLGQMKLVQDIGGIYNLYALEPGR